MVVLIIETSKIISSFFHSRGGLRILTVADEQGARLASGGGPIAIELAALGRKAVVGEVVLMTASGAGGDAGGVHGEGALELAVVAVGADGIVAIEHAAEAVADDDARGVADAENEGRAHLLGGEGDGAGGALVALEGEVVGRGEPDAAEHVRGHGVHGRHEVGVEMRLVVEAQIYLPRAELVLDLAAGGKRNYDAHEDFGDMPVEVKDNALALVYYNDEYWNELLLTGIKAYEKGLKDAIKKKAEAINDLFPFMNNDPYMQEILKHNL